MFPSRSFRHEDVLRELPVSSIDSDANIGRSLRSASAMTLALSPEGPPLVPIHTTGGGGDGPFCSPVQYVYSTGRTRRRLELGTDNERPVTPTFEDFTPQYASTPGPSTPHRSQSRTLQSARKRHWTQTSDYFSHPGSPEEAILEESVSWLRRAKKARLERRESSSELTKRLQALTADQLATVISDLVRKHPDLEEDLQEIIPEPDISSYEEKICDLLHSVYRAMPRQRLSSSRSAFHYRRVRLHIIKFKKECVQHGRHFLHCRAWDAAIKYVLVAWRHVHKLPVWECPAHNRLKVTCYQGLAAVCVEALRKGDFSRDVLEAWRPRIEEMCSAAPEMIACIQRLNLVIAAVSES
ncbi:uncharacterized protein [Diadema setosum]|uniref:uncharacterized protein n=1 Tax=Diadema setosum TaxID=31175 RepID=UPI003B3A20BD